MEEQAAERGSGPFAPFAVTTDALSRAARQMVAGALDASGYRGDADRVLLDMPCSGTGTWRRNPETRWRLTPERLERLVRLQDRLLGLAAELVRPGGHLTYAVCSLLAAEGRDRAAALGARSSLVPEPAPIAAGRPAGPGIVLSPAREGTDGFFIARWRRPC